MTYIKITECSNQTNSNIALLWIMIVKTNLINHLDNLIKTTFHIEIIMNIKVIFLKEMIHLLILLNKNKSIQVKHNS